MPVTCLSIVKGSWGKIRPITRQSPPRLLRYTKGQMYRAAGSAVSPSASPFTLDPLEPRVLMAASPVPLAADPPLPPAIAITARRSRDIVSAQDRQQLLNHLTPALQAD